MPVLTLFNLSVTTGQMDGWSNLLIEMHGYIMHQQGRIHGYPSRVRVDRDCNLGQCIIWAGAVRPEAAKTKKK